MLYEYSILVPAKYTSEEGKEVETNIAAFQEMFLERFGGYTKTSTEGAWLDDVGNVYYDCNFDFRLATESSEDYMCRLAFDIGTQLRQKAVYIRMPDGRVKTIVC